MGGFLSWNYTPFTAYFSRGSESILRNGFLKKEAAHCNAQFYCFDTNEQRTLKAKTKPLSADHHNNTASRWVQFYMMRLQLIFTFDPSIRAENDSRNRIYCPHLLLYPMCVLSSSFAQSSVIFLPVTDELSFIHFWDHEALCVLLLRHVLDVFKEKIFFF